jgi:hypothetical protein
VPEWLTLSTEVAATEVSVMPVSLSTGTNVNGPQPEPPRTLRDEIDLEAIRNRPSLAQLEGEGQRTSVEAQHPAVINLAFSFGDGATTRDSHSALLDKLPNRRAGIVAWCTRFLASSWLTLDSKKASSHVLIGGPSARWWVVT